MGLRFVKVRRCARRVPREAARFLIAPVFSPGQILMFFASVIALALFLQTASGPERDVQATEWAIAIEAFVIALLGWAAVSLVCAPFIVVRDDWRRGRWHGRHLVYHRPILIATERFEALEGKTQRRSIRFEDAEPNAFVYFMFEFTPKAVGRIGAHVHGGILPADVELNEAWKSSGDQHIGTRLPADRSAILCVRLEPATVPVICRIWCHSFFIGKGDGPNELR